MYKDRPTWSIKLWHMKYSIWYLHKFETLEYFKTANELKQVLREGQTGAHHHLFKTIPPHDLKQKKKNQINLHLGLLQEANQG